MPNHSRNDPPAIVDLIAAVDRQPDSPEARFHLADAQLAAGRIADAAQQAAEAVRLGAAGPSTRELWAAALAASGELHAALVVLRAADSPPRPTGDYLRTLGKRLARAGVRDHALQLLRRALEHDRDDLEAAHLVAALSGRNPEHPDIEYVRCHFDEFAAGFDEQLLHVLDYSGPREVKKAVLAVSTRAPPWKILDLGCGTGLVAVELADLSSRIDGVDVAPKMIERAGQRGLYSALICDEVLRMLSRCTVDRYDLVTAADVFIYVGRLDELIAAVRKVLRPNGMLAFTAEAAESSSLQQASVSPGYWLDHTGRYAHSAAYLESLAKSHQFTVQMQRQIPLRLQSGRNVAAWLAVWSSGGAAPI